VAPDKHARRIRIFCHSLCHAVFQIFLIRSVLDDGDHEGVEEGQSSTHSTNTNTFDHLQMYEISSIVKTTVE
jgi:hypothetical protein